MDAGRPITFIPIVGVADVFKEPFCGAQQGDSPTCGAFPWSPEADVLRRDIYDRVPIMQWSKGRVTLLGDSAHAMQPNMGQGGYMAIEVRASHVTLQSLSSVCLYFFSPFKENGSQGHVLEKI